MTTASRPLSPEAAAGDSAATLRAGLHTNPRISGHWPLPDKSQVRHHDQEEITGPAAPQRVSHPVQAR
ncbi:hypothetical protein [Herbaspirillum frisingense]|uniref:hypothetical protein n=1 Tax=Herbaspirillum frisingense TaxID=92645 RepID=UPI001F170138|nr:hypothetical protein [Herbaspirillum frisingense]UIN20482.1 hypothetical protein LAZ82_18655 [Herbaspirillum frisingense]